MRWGEIGGSWWVLSTRGQACHALSCHEFTTAVQGCSFPSPLTGPHGQTPILLCVCVSRWIRQPQAILHHQRPVGRGGRLRVGQRVVGGLQLPVTPQTLQVGSLKCEQRVACMRTWMHACIPRICTCLCTMACPSSAYACTCTCMHIVQFASDKCWRMLVCMHSHAHGHSHSDISPGKSCVLDAVTHWLPCTHIYCITLLTFWCFCFVSHKCVLLSPTPC